MKTSPKSRGGAVWRWLDREYLSMMLTPEWEPISPESEDGSIVFRRGDKVIAKFESTKLMRELSDPHQVAFGALVAAINQDAWVTHFAIEVAKLELGTAAKRKAGGKTTATDRRQEAAARDLLLGKAAKQILAATGPMPNTELADLLAERTGRGAKAIRKKLPKLR